VIEVQEAEVVLEEESDEEDLANRKRSVGKSQKITK